MPKKSFRGIAPFILLFSRFNIVISFEKFSAGIVPLRSSDAKLIPIVRRNATSEEFEPHVTPLKEHHGGGRETSVYSDGKVAHEVSP